MEINLEDIDIDRLRDALMDYFGTAKSYFPMATMDLINVSDMSDIELVEKAIELNINILDYLKEKQR